MDDLVKFIDPTTFKKMSFISISNIIKGSESYNVIYSFYHIENGKLIDLNKSNFQ